MLVLKLILFIMCFVIGMGFVGTYIINYLEMKRLLKHHEYYKDLEVIFITFRQFLTLRKVMDLEVDSIDSGIISYKKAPHHIIGFDFNFLSYILMTPIICYARLRTFHDKIKKKRNAKREKKIENNQRLLALLNDISTTQ